MKKDAALRPVLRGLLVLGLGLASVGPALAQAVLAARVNGAAIPHELLDRQYEELLRERRIQVARMRDPAKAKAIKREALDNLIRIELLWQQAKAIGLVVTDEDVDRAVADTRSRFRSAEAFERHVAQIGFDDRGYRDHTRKLLSGERVAQRVVDRDVRITDQDIEDFYEVNPRLFRRGEQVRARQILVAVPANATTEQKVQARRKIDALLERARAGESFEALARQHSDDATRQWGGALDPAVRGEHPGVFDDVAFSLPQGALSDVIEVAAGFYILKVEERIPAASIPIGDARERIRGYLIHTRGKEAIDREVEQLRSQGKVELLTPL